MTPRLTISLLLGGSITAALLVWVQDHSDQDCHIFELSRECDLSSWLGLILGDIMIGVSLALVFHFLISKNNLKIAAATLKVDAILSEQKKIRDRRESYVIQALKNQFASLLLCMGIINNFSDSTDEKKRTLAAAKRRDMDKILTKGYSVLGLSIDVLDPMLIGQIESIFTQVSDSMEEHPDGKLANSDDIKAQIKNLTARLDEYEHAGKILK